MEPTKEVIIDRFKEVQDYICSRLEDLDGKAKFHEDPWERQEGGGGRTRIITEGKIFEKGGVNFSAVHGPVSELMKKQLNLDGNEFLATGVSIVLHPHHPFIPIMHMNIRYFEMDNGNYWFGGGIDMTPHYVNTELAGAFHRELKKICDRYHTGFYSKFKEWADDYFFLPHREETRGVGGIFYDHLTDKSGVSKSELVEFAVDLGRIFPELYKYQVVKNLNHPYSEENMRWRNIRRGRYVEFNLVHDKGTQFGLKTGGRIESILMSLPTNASWYYDFKVAEDSKEANTLLYLKKGVNWIEL
ncbi:MAG: oxygen-dependent coproporphyrinogen oxidase [Brumimicrobium sp.]|nr:oxygen-dependent coproporphyrinogen oxidase [Brumimicrobium sp.]